MEQTVTISLSGGILPGFDPADVARSLAALLKLSEQQALHLLLSGKETIVKRQLPADKAERYVAAIHATGASTRVEPSEAPIEFPTLDTAVPDGAPPMPAPALAPAPVPAPQPVALPAYMTAPVAVPPPVATPAPAAAPAPAAKPELALMDEPAQDTITCPVCNTEQPKRTLCRQCGADMPRVLAAALARTNEPAPKAAATAPAAGTTRSFVGRDDPLMAGDNFYWVDSTPKPFRWDFSGRLGRVRFLAYLMLMTALMVPVGILAALLIPHSGMGISAGVRLLGFALGAALTVQAVRLVMLRLHDIGLSGMWIALPFAGSFLGILLGPLIILVVAGISCLGWLALCVIPGSDGGNDYGPPSDGGGIGMKALAALYVILSVNLTFYQAAHLPSSLIYPTAKPKVAAPQSSYQASQPAGGFTSSDTTSQPVIQHPQFDDQPPPAEIGDATLDYEIGNAIDRRAAARHIQLTPEQRRELIEQARESYRASHHDPQLGQQRWSDGSN